MSTPVGQSDEQPLQDRQRSRDSATSAAAKPCTSVPLASSCSTLARPRVGRVVWFTLWSASVATAVTVALGVPVAYALHRLSFPGQRVLRGLVAVPFVLPTVVVGSAFLGLLGRGGLLEDLWGVRLDTTVWAILLAHVFFNYAVVVRTVGGLWSQLDPRQEEAARMLGAGRFAAWRRVTLPALAPSVAAAALMVFLFTFTSFGVIQVLGGPRFGVDQRAFGEPDGFAHERQHPHDRGGDLLQILV